MSNEKAKVKTEEGTTIITSEIEINAPVERVWMVLSDIGGIEKFHPLVKKSKNLSNENNGLGAKRHCELLPMGEMVEQVSEWKEQSLIELKVIDGKMLPPYRFMKGKIRLNERGSKTKVSFSFSYELKFGLMGKLLNTLMIKPQFKKAPPQYVRGLKEYVEGLSA